MTLDVVLLYGPRRGVFLMSEVPLNCFERRFGVRVWGAGFRSSSLAKTWPGSQGSGFRVQGSGFGVWGLGFGVWGLGFGVWGLGVGLGG